MAACGSVALLDLPPDLGDRILETFVFLNSILDRLEAHASGRFVCGIINMSNASEASVTAYARLVPFFPLHRNAKTYGNSQCMKEG